MFFSLAHFKRVDDTLLEIVEALQDRIAFRDRQVVLEDARGVKRVVVLSGVPVFDSETREFLGYRGTGSEIGSAGANVEEAEAVARFRSFAEVAADWLWETDEALRISFLSEGYGAQAALTPEQSLGQVMPDLWRGDASLRARIELRQPFRWAKARWPSEQGEAADFLICGRPTFDQAGGFAGYRGIALAAASSPVTDTRPQSAKDAADQTSYAKSEHLSNLSHELRTPLNAIIGFSDAMRNEIMGALPNDQYRQYAQDIHDSARHLLEMVNGVLDLSRIEAGKMELDEEQADVREVIEECRRMLRDQADKAGLAMTVETEEDLPHLVVDRVKLKQILLNLLSNAFKFTMPGGQVAVIGRLTGTGSLEIEVRDTGVGIDSDDIPKVLARFGQAEAGRGRQGSGLGLTITKSLVELHGGVLKIVSGEGVGTRALVQFPKERVILRDDDQAGPWKILF